MKDHVWFKSYQWKDLYDKKLDAPFIPKIGDNFDPKYCNATDQIGLITHAKYERLLKEEYEKPSFEQYYFYYNQFDSKDPNNSVCHKFSNPHATLTTTSVFLIKSKKTDALPKILASPSISINSKLTKSKNLSTCDSAASIFEKNKVSRLTALSSTIKGPMSNPVAMSYRFRKSGSVNNQFHKCS